MNVTSLHPDPRTSGCVVIEIDGDRLASLPVERVHVLGLEVGRTLGGAEVERLEQAVQAENAYRAAARMLTARSRSVFELRTRLRAKGHPEWAAVQALGRLQDSGVLDDAQFAQHFSRVRLTRGYGPSRVLSELLRRGVERQVAERAIDDAVQSEGLDPVGQAEALARKRLRQLGSLPRQKRAQRVAAFLQRRGFPQGTVRNVVQRLLQETGAPG